MRAAILLDLDEVEFIEPTFEDLADDKYTGMILSMPAKAAKLLISTDDYPLAVALDSGKGWKCTSFLLRRPDPEIFDKLEELDAEIFQEEKNEWQAAVREYYSLRIAEEVPPALDDFNPGRVLNISRLINNRWGSMEGEICIDACCGSGAGSVALRSLGMLPISFDNDPSLLSLGLRKGRLMPEETMCLDGTHASKYLTRCEYGIMLMAGEIGPHNAPFWRKITHEMIEVTELLLVTVGTEREARQIQSWAQEKECRVQTFENEGDPFYDRWACEINKV
ncbi:MAG: hypothetical protein QW520_01370 [Methanomassiliicoccales archaeon]